MFGYGLFGFLLVGAVESAFTLPLNGDRPLASLVMVDSFYVSSIPYILWCVVSTVVLWYTDHDGLPVGGDRTLRLRPVQTAGPSDHPTAGVNHNLDHRIYGHCQRYGIARREQEILRAIACGRSNQQIADRLFISLQTVKTHAHHLYQKTDTSSRTALVASLQSFQ